MKISLIGLTVIFIILKCCGVLSPAFTWLWVFSPIWIGLLIMVWIGVFIGSGLIFRMLMTFSTVIYLLVMLAKCLS